jgi:hypothetical protein
MQTLHPRFHHAIFSFAAFVVIAMTNCSSSVQAAVFSYGLSKVEDYQQTSNTQPATPTSLSGLLNVDFANATDLTAAHVTAASPLSPMTLSAAPGEYEFLQSSPTLTALDTNFPASTVYQYSISGGTLGAKSASLTSPATDLFPSPVPFFNGSEFSQLQGMNSALPFDFTWNGFTPPVGVNSASILFSITNVSGDPGSSWSNSGTNTFTSDVLPGNSLLPGATYDVALTYVASIFTPNAGFGTAESDIGFFRRTDIVFTTARVPEPSSLALLLAGGAGLLVWLAKRRSRIA